MSAHTPGPWHSKRVMAGSSPTRSLVYFKVQTKGGAAVVAGTSVFCGKVGGQTVTISDEECTANARLIAAAPDLLAALEEMIDALGFGSESVAVKHARAAIAKAVKP